MIAAISISRLARRCWRVSGFKGFEFFWVDGLREALPTARRDDAACYTRRICFERARPPVWDRNMIRGRPTTVGTTTLRIAALCIALDAGNPMDVRRRSGVSRDSRATAMHSSRRRNARTTPPTRRARRLSDRRNGRQTVFTPHTYSTVERLREVLGEIRRNGYVVTDQQLELGVRGVAVPLRDRHGSVVAAISVSMPVGQESASAALQRVLPTLLETASLLRNLV
jgi:hypothetical protein